MIFAMAVRYSNGTRTGIIDNGIKGIIGDYSKALDSTDENLKGNAIRTASGAQTNEPNGVPFAGLISKYGAKLDDVTKKEIETAAVGYKAALLVDDITKPIFSDVLQDIDKVGGVGYKPMNASNTVKVQDILDKGYDFVKGSSTVVYSPSSESGMMIAMTIKKKNNSKSMGGDTSSEDSGQGTVYIPIDKTGAGTNGIATGLLTQAINNNNNKVLNWFNRTATNTGNNSNFNLKHKLDVTKLGKNVRDVSINFTDNTVYIETLENNKPTVTSYTISEKWEDIVNAFKF
jgi:hypothetical protein